MGHSQITIPQKVGIAVKLLYITLGYGVLSIIMQASMLTRIESPAYVFITVFVLWILWFLYFMIGKGHNWARITYLVWLILGIPFFVRPILLTLGANYTLGMLSFGSVVIQVVALVLLFQKPSSEWFKEMKANKQHKLQQPEKG